MKVKFSTFLERISLLLCFFVPVFLLVFYAPQSHPISFDEEAIRSFRYGGPLLFHAVSPLFLRPLLALSELYKEHVASSVFSFELSKARCAAWFGAFFLGLYGAFFTRPLALYPFGRDGIHGSISAQLMSSKNTEAKLSWVDIWAKTLVSLSFTCALFVVDEASGPGSHLVAATLGIAFVHIALKYPVPSSSPFLYFFAGLILSEDPWVFFSLFFFLAIFRRRFLGSGHAAQAKSSAPWISAFFFLGLSPLLLQFIFVDPSWSSHVSLRDRVAALIHEVDRTEGRVPSVLIFFFGLLAPWAVAFVLDKAKKIADKLWCKMHVEHTMRVAQVALVMVFFTAAPCLVVDRTQLALQNRAKAQRLIWTKWAQAAGLNNAAGLGGAGGLGDEASPKGLDRGAGIKPRFTENRVATAAKKNIEVENAPIKLAGHTMVDMVKTPLLFSAPVEFKVDEQLSSFPPFGSQPKFHAGSRPVLIFVKEPRYYLRMMAAIAAGEWPENDLVLAEFSLTGTHAQMVLSAHPDLRPAFRDLAIHKKLSEFTLTQLSEKYTILLLEDHELSESLSKHLLPYGFLVQFHPDVFGASEREEKVVSQNDFFSAFFEHIGEKPEGESSRLFHKLLRHRALMFSRTREIKTVDIATQLLLKETPNDNFALELTKRVLLRQTHDFSDLKP